MKESSQVKFKTERESKIFQCELSFWTEDVRTVEKKNGLRFMSFEPSAASEALWRETKDRIDI